MTGGTEGSAGTDDRGEGTGREFSPGGKGGAAGGELFAKGGGGGGTGEGVEIVDDGLRDAGGGMGGFLPIGGGGFGLGVSPSVIDGELVDLKLLLRADGSGNAGAAPGGRGGAPGGLGALLVGGGGARGGLEMPPDFLAFVSGSESYMFTPPALFRSFGIPPANSPPNCGAASTPVDVLLGTSLLLLIRF